MKSLFEIIYNKIHVPWWTRSYNNVNQNMRALLANRIDSGFSRGSMLSTTHVENEVRRELIQLNFYEFK
jgi:hypothetical protein